MCSVSRNWRGTSSNRVSFAESQTWNITDTSSLGFTETMNPGLRQELNGSVFHQESRCNVKMYLAVITAFETDYGHWVEEQNRQICELRTVLHGSINDIELRLLVDNAMKHYFELFQMKSTATKADVFFVMLGMWKTSAERFFLWIGGFRPSDLIKVLLPHLDPLTDQQLLDVCNLRQSCQQAEDALSLGMDNLQYTLAENIAAGQLGEGNYVPQVTSAMERFQVLVNFVNQADHTRHETLQHMYRILTTRQAARGLLALGEYFQRLRSVSSSWETRHCGPT